MVRESVCPKEVRAQCEPAPMRVRQVGICPGVSRPV